MLNQQKQQKRNVVQEKLAPWADLALGETVSGELCPFCLGGDNEEESFSITKNDAGVLLYICHRNKCNRAGAVNPDGSHLIQVHTKTKKHKVFDEPTELLTKEQLLFFEKKYGLSEKEIDKAKFLWVPERKAVYQPIFSPDGRIRGTVIRRYHDKDIKTYKANEDSREPNISWYAGPRSFDDNACVIVEDILSALKLSRYHNACALNGTHMSNEAVLEIMQWSKHQYLALDRDAIQQALKQAERWKSLLNIKVVECILDPKYWNDDQLKRLKE